MSGKIYQSNQGYVVQPDGSKKRDWLYPALGQVVTQGIQMTSANMDEMRVYTPGHVHASVRAAQTAKPTAAYWIADVESDPFRTDPHDFKTLAAAGLQKTMELVSLARQVAGDMPIGLYGDFPANLYWGQVASAQASLAAQDALANAVDVICIRAYTNEATYLFSEWQRMMDKMVLGMQRWASKPLLTYLWDRVQQSPDRNGAEGRLSADAQLARIKYALTVGDVCLWVHDMPGYAVLSTDPIVAAVNAGLAELAQ